MLSLAVILQKRFKVVGMVKALRTRLEHDFVESFSLLGNEHPKSYLVSYR